MKGVITTPILAALLATLIFHTPTAAAAAFLAVIGIEIVVIVATVRGAWRRS